MIGSPTPQKNRDGDLKPYKYLWTVICPYFVTCKQATCKLLPASIVCLYLWLLSPLRFFGGSKSLSFPKCLWPFLSQLFLSFGILKFYLSSHLSLRESCPTAILRKGKEPPIGQFLMNVESKHVKMFVLSHL